MHATDFIYVDIETTGGNAARDRITEIAWIHASNGEVIAERSQLLNPGAPIPYHIQQFTGITNQMVAHCPRFEDIAAELLDQLSDKVFVAHNARFDYGFIKNAFRRCDTRFSAPVLCTVKLSRRLYPQYKRHNLDSLIERHRLHCENRHRALGDAQVLYQFVERAKQEHGLERVQHHIAELLKSASLPPGIDAQELEDIAYGPGVYVFYDADDIPLYVGKSVNMRSRVLAHFNSDYRSPKDMRIKQSLARIETIASAGELGALLKEAQLVKELAPVHNRKLRPCATLYTIDYEPGDIGEQPTIVEFDHQRLAGTAPLFGLFKSQKQARNRLKKLAAEYDLCLRTLGLESGSGPCFNYQIKKCRGVCAGRENVLQHQMRVVQALAALKLRRWPYTGPIAIRETSSDGELRETHFVDCWCYLGSVDSHAQYHAAELLQRSARFDQDAYKILTRYLSKRTKKLDIVRTGREFFSETDLSSD